MRKIVNNLFISTVVLVGSFFAITGVALISQDSLAYAANTTSQIRDGVDGAGGSGEGGDKVVATIKNVINILLFLIGLFAVVMIVIAGFRFVTSNGDANTVTQAKNTIIYAVIGIVVAVMAYAIVNFILNQIT